MPNWCNNTIELRASTEKVVEFQKFLDEKEGKNWFDFFAPCPQELMDVGAVDPKNTNEELIEKYGYSDWYSFGVGEWGCKWNCDAQNWTVEEDEDGRSVIKFWFDSPWGPPDVLYEKINDPADLNGWSVYAEWNEEGMQFVGYFDEGFGETYEYDSLESLDDIPEFLVESWNLRENLEQWQDDEEAEEDYDIAVEIDEEDEKK
jgi:hypothetical protein